MIFLLAILKKCILGVSPECFNDICWACNPDWKCIEMVSSLLRKLCLTMLQIRLVSFDLNHLRFPFWVQTFIGLEVGWCQFFLCYPANKDSIQTVMAQALGPPPMPANLTCQQTPQILEFNPLNSKQDNVCHDFGLCQIAWVRDHDQGHLVSCSPALRANTI